LCVVAAASTFQASEGCRAGVTACWTEISKPCKRCGLPFWPSSGLERERHSQRTLTNHREGSDDKEDVPGGCATESATNGGPDKPSYQAGGAIYQSTVTSWDPLPEARHPPQQPEARLMHLI
jgi:hypothetical protein